MKTLYIERSVSTGRGGEWVEALELSDVERLVVGMGPGSFAGIRSALAFAQGFSLGSGAEVFGLPSPCAIAAEFAASGEPLAVVGDARRSKYWIALFDGWRLVCPIFQVDQESLHLRVPLSARVVSPDDARIGALLKETFENRYLGERKPTDEGLQRYAEEQPTALIREPLPIYLNPAVRD